MGDFNDFELSRPLRLLTDPAEGGQLTGALERAPLEGRYSYNFGGVSQLLDNILVSPALQEQVIAARILHTNADYPAGWRFDAGEHPAFRSSDHDPPLVILQTGEPPTPTPTPLPTPMPSKTATPIPSPTLTATLTPTVPPTVAATSTAMPAPTAPQDGSGALAWVAGAAIVGGAAVLLLLLRRRV
jgi:hypothetical protein